MREEYDDVGHLRCRAVRALLDLGGDALLADVHAVATAYVDRRLPWDGRGEEPAERSALYEAILWRFAELLRDHSPAARLPPPA